MGNSFFKGCAFMKMGEVPESYPPKKITIMNVPFGLSGIFFGFTRFYGPDKLIDQCWTDPMIPGYLRITSQIFSGD